MCTILALLRGSLYFLQDNLASDLHGFDFVLLKGVHRLTSLSRVCYHVALSCIRSRMRDLGKQILLPNPVGNHTNREFSWYTTSTDFHCSSFRD